MNKHLRSLHARPDHIPLLEFRYYSLLRVIHTLGFLSHFGFLVVFYLLCITELAYVQFVSLSVFAFAMFLNGKRKYI